MTSYNTWTNEIEHRLTEVKARARHPSDLFSAYGSSFHSNPLVIASLALGLKFV